MQNHTWLVNLRRLKKSDENEDIEKVKRDQFMMKIASSSDEEIMDMIVNGEINYEYFKQDKEKEDV